MAESAFGSPALPGFSVVRGTVPPALLIVEVESAIWKPSPREERLLAALDAAGLHLACALLSPSSKLTANESAEGNAHRRSKTQCGKVGGPAGVDSAASTCPIVSQLLTHQIVLNNQPSPEVQLVALCRKLGTQPIQTALIASTPASLPIAPKAGTLLALKGAGCQNEAAADRVFEPRSEGGLEKALEYVVRRTHGRARLDVRGHVR